MEKDIAKELKECKEERYNFKRMYNNLSEVCHLRKAGGKKKSKRTKRKTRKTRKNK